MEEGIKRKLVGAGVLMAVALVVLPQITPKKQNAEYLADSVPLESNIPNMEMPLPKSIPVANLSSTANDEQTTTIRGIQVDGQVSEAHSFAKPVLDNTGQAQVWQIQVGSFAKPENAKKLKNRLRKAGFKAFEQLGKDGKYVRVFVGPNTQKSQLEKQLKQIQSQFKLTGKITPFNG